MGIYTIAVSIAGFTGVLSRAVGTVILPTVAGKVTAIEQRNEIISFFQRYWIISIVFHLAFAITVWFLLPIIYGSAYSESVTICQILIIGYFFINVFCILFFELCTEGI